MRGRSIKLTLLVGCAAVVAVVAVQAAAGAGATVVRGDQLLEGASNCPNADPFTYRMAGDLVGCWYTDSGEVRNATPSGVIIVSGTEHFVGCLNTNGNQTCDPGEPFGTFNTTYTFSSKYAASGDEIHGRGHHPIIGGTGGVLGASGELSFTDIPSEGRFPYHGPIRL
jgi:hypothetical protein